MRRRMLNLAMLLLLAGCQVDSPQVSGIYSSRISHEIFTTHRLSIHSRVRFSNEQFLEIRSYRVKFNDGTSATDVDIGIMTLAGHLTRHDNTLKVVLNQVKMEMDADLYREYVTQPRPELAMVDVPMQLRHGELQFQVLQQDSDTLCLDRKGGHPQCYVLSQVIAQ